MLHTIPGITVSDLYGLFTISNTIHAVMHGMDVEKDDKYFDTLMFIKTGLVSKCLLTCENRFFIIEEVKLLLMEVLHMVLYKSKLDMIDIESIQFPVGEHTIGKFSQIYEPDKLTLKDAFFISEDIKAIYYNYRKAPLTCLFRFLKIWKNLGFEMQDLLAWYTSHHILAILSKQYGHNQDRWVKSLEVKSLRSIVYDLTIDALKIPRYNYDTILSDVLSSALKIFK